MIRREHSPLELFRDPVTDKEAATKGYVDANIGAGSGDAYHRHQQEVASDTWPIGHGLGRFPVIQTVDTAGNVVEGEIQHLDMDNALASFSVAFSGEAYCC